MRSLSNNELHKTKKFGAKQSKTTTIKTQEV